MPFRITVLLLISLLALTACRPLRNQPVRETGETRAAAAEKPRQLTAGDYRRAERFLPQNLEKYVRNASLTPNWIGEEDRFWYKRQDEAGEKQFVTVDAATGKKMPSFDHAAIAHHLQVAVEAEKARAQAEAEAAAAEAGEQPPVVPEADASGESEALPFDTFTYNDDGGIEIVLDKTTYRCTAEGCEASETPAPAFPPGFAASPDGNWGVYFKDHNLWLKSADGEIDAALTTDGESDFGYGMEVGTSTSYISKRRMGMPPTPQIKWAPDSSKFLTMRIDQREVGELSLIEYAPEDGTSRPRTHTWRAALSTDPVKPMGTFVVFSMEPRSRMDIDHPAMELVYDTITTQESGDVWWHENADGFGFAHRKPCARGYALHDVDLASGEVTLLYDRTSQRTSHPGMSTPLPAQARRLGDGSLVYYSDESNWGHLYYRTADGLTTQITSGPWNVVALLRVDEEAGRIIYMRTRPEAEGNPYLLSIHRIGLDGSGDRVLTPEQGSHFGLMAVLSGPGAFFSPSGKYFVNNYASMRNPGTSELRDVDGNLIAVLDHADISKLQEGGLVPPQSFTARAADGVTTLYGNIHFPSDFDPGRPYPIIDSIYPGPQVTRVLHDMVNTMYKFGAPQALAELGFIVITVDGRGTPLRSRDFLYPPDVNVLAKAGFLEDHIAAMEQLAQRHAYIDLDRAGIYGWSGGGYASTRAMFVYPEFFKVAVSGAGNHDQRTYIPVWGESYVGEDNGDNYAAASNPHLAKNLKGRLYLVHGALDDNVHPANTMQVVEALIDANKDFDLLMLPNANHRPGAATAYFTRRQWDYFVTHLQGALPPQGYEIVLPEP